MESEVRSDFKVQYVTQAIIVLAVFIYLIYNLDWLWRALIVMAFSPLLFISFYPQRIFISENQLFLKKNSRGERKYNLQTDIEKINSSFTSQTRGAFVFKGYEVLEIIFKDGEKLTFDQNQYKNYFALKEAIYKCYFFNKV